MVELGFCDIFESFVVRQVKVDVLEYALVGLLRTLYARLQVKVEPLPRL